MAKLTVHTEASPSSAEKSANQLVYVTDAKGRKLGLRELPFLESFRIMETVGPELAANQTYMGMLNPLLTIAEIDGEPISIPRSKLAVEALIQQAGIEGSIAASLGIKEHFKSDNPELERQIKNLLGTQDS